MSPTQIQETGRREISRREQAEETLKERLEFEALLSDLSARFVHLPPEEVDREIELALKAILDFFQVDRCGLVRTLPGRSAYQITHAANSEDVPPVPAGSDIPISLNPWAYEKMILKREVVAFSRIDDLPSEAQNERRVFQSRNMKSLLSIPLLSGKRTLGSCALVSTRAERTWPEDLVQRFRLITTVFANALARRQMEGQLRERLGEIERLKRELEMENLGLRQEAQLLFEHREIVGASPAIKRVLLQVEQVAKTTATVLLTGETGTGKELVARAIHRLSLRRGKPLITVNCASLPPSLIESELFGREKGAFTGALTRQAGRFEIADGSTLFLDEIGELPLELQGKLLRVLEEGRFERLGSTRTIRVDVRLIAATHRDIKKEAALGNFREDLYYRINVFPIEIPPLRERAEDIPLLVWAFINEFSEKVGKKIQTVTRKTMEALQRYPWPGNVRELRNVIERAVIISSGEFLQVQIPLLPDGNQHLAITLEEAEHRHVLGVLEKTGWRIKGPGGAAEILGLKPSSLYSLMQRLGIPTKQKKDVIST